MRFSVVCAALVAAIALCAPVSAAQQLISFSGQAFLAPSGTPIAALSALAGGTVTGGFIVNTAAAGFQPVGPVGGQGQGALLTGAITDGLVIFNGPGGSLTLARNGNDFGNIFTVDNGGVPSNPANRVDQMGYSTSSRVVSNSILQPYTLAGTLPNDVFFGSLFFGRILQAPFPSDPDMITDVATRDFAGVLTGPHGGSPFLSIIFRQGNPNGTVLVGMPQQALSIGNLQLSITNIGEGVPEPASWALLIIGFGLTGAVMRRRKGLAAA